MLLDNPIENPCFGCGPRHPRGLRLNFERRRADDGADEVVVTYAPKPDEIGWPTLMHTGLHFLVLYEVSYWGAWELGGKVMNSHGDSVFNQQRLPRTGKPFTAAARLGEKTEEGFCMDAVSTSAEGKPCATLKTLWRPASRAGAERAGLKLPAYLLQDMAP